MADVELFFRAAHPLGEAIIWHGASRCLLWIDLLDPALFRHDPASGRTESWALPLSPPIGAIVATTDPDLLVVTHRDGLSLLRISDRSLAAYCNPESGRDAIIWNDAKCDRWGRLWAGTSHAFEREARGALWCIAHRSRYALADAGFAISNGPAVSPDGSILYFNDSVGRTTYAYDIRPDDLHARNRRALIRFGPGEGVPDGIVTDADGCLWIAHWGGGRVSRFAPDGRLIAAYAVPARNITTMCFGGADLTTLYITTARDDMDAKALADLPLSGSLFRLEAGVRGLAEPLFDPGSAPRPASA